MWDLYEGKLKAVQGYSGAPGDAYIVTVAASDLYGGAVSFDINEALKLTVEKRRLTAAMEPGAGEIRLVTPGKPVEHIFIKLGEGGSPQFLKLQLNYRQEHREAFMACGELARKE